MGTDINWVLERKDTSGEWHTVMTQGYFFCFIYDSQNGNMPWEHPLYIVGRDYQLFAYLSNVRNEDNETDDYIMNDGMPGNPSDGLAQYYEANHDCDYSFGWTDGAQARDHPYYQKKRVKDFFDKCEKALEHKEVRGILPLAASSGSYEDGIDCTAHQRMRNLEKTFIDIKQDPSAWRIFVSYDC